MRVSVLTILMAFLLAAGIPFGVMAGPAPDTDNDTVPDAVDNCLTTANAPQCDTDADGYGNLCDADVNADGVIDVADYPAIDNNIGDTAPFVVPGADINCDGTVDIADYPGIDNNIGGAPGPSGLWCAGVTTPCP